MLEQAALRVALEIASGAQQLGRNYTSFNESLLQTESARSPKIRV